MWSGTDRRGLTTPGSTRPSRGLWQRLYLRPLPHQHGSFAVGSTAGGVLSVVTPKRLRADLKRRSLHARVSRYE